MSLARIDALIVAMLHIAALAASSEVHPPDHPDGKGVARDGGADVGLPDREARGDDHTGDGRAGAVGSSNRMIRAAECTARMISRIR